MPRKSAKKSTASAKAVAKPSPKSASKSAAKSAAKSAGKRAAARAGSKSAAKPAGEASKPAKPAATASPVKPAKSVEPAKPARTAKVAKPVKLPNTATVQWDASPAERKREQRLVKDVANIGWHSLHVTGDGAIPDFVYSVGLMETYGHPEIIVFGLPMETMHDLLSNFVAGIDGGRLFARAGSYDGIVDGFSLATRPMNTQNHCDFVGYALWHRAFVGKGGDLRVVQCFWPDKAGVFPFEKGCTETVAALQPRLDLAPPPKR